MFLFQIKSNLLLSCGTQTIDVTDGLEIFNFKLKLERCVGRKKNGITPPHEIYVQLIRMQILYVIECQCKHEKYLIETVLLTLDQ